MRKTFTKYFPLLFFVLGRLISLSLATSVSSSSNATSVSSPNYSSSSASANSSINDGSGSGSGIDNDQDAMDALKKQITGAAENLKNWNSTAYCAWDGITCDNDQRRVKSIDLSARDITGALPSDALDSLTYLETLFLQNNKFYGSLPRLTNLYFLKEINLSCNNFTDVYYDGTFANLTSLRNLSISHNPDLSPWNFPLELADSKSLLTLSANNANINGPIPDFLASFRSLQFLNLSHNDFTGTIPNGLSSLPSLVKIDISNNGLNGTIPVFRTGVSVLYAGNDFAIGGKSSFVKKRNNNVVNVLKSALLAITGLVVSLMIIYFVTMKCCMKRWWCKQKISQEDIELSCGSPVKFSYQDLVQATNDFDSQMNLGKGGSCNVFRGHLSNGDTVAVKQLKGSELSAKAFEAEVNSLGNTRHCNVVQMVGYCVEKPHRLIVYEYMDNGSLDKWIFGVNRERSLAWDEKYKIIKQIASGLYYLQECLYKNRILHRDIKPHNVLLDKDFNAKLSDFGLAKILSNDKTSTVSQGGGTFGYMAPEVLRPGNKSEKSDVYSYGVVVLEIVFEKRSWCLTQSEEDSLGLIDLVKTKVQAKQLHDLVDAMGENMLAMSPEIEKTVKLGLWCLNNDRADRPSMAEVVKVLEGFAMVPEDKIDYTRTLPFFDATQHLPVVVEEKHSNHQHSDVTLSVPR